MSIFNKKENDKDWKYNADNDMGGSVFNDPILKQKVIKATRRYVENKFGDETEGLRVSVSVVNVTEGIRYEMPNYEVKVVADFSIDTDEGESEQALNSVIKAINRKLESQLDGDAEGRYVSAKVNVFPKGTDAYFRFVYVGPGMYDDVNSLETRDDYFNALMSPIKKDIDLIYRVIGYYG